MNEKKTLESDAVNHGNNFCHPAHDDEQQQQAAAAAATAVEQHTTQQQAGIYENILVRRVAAFRIRIIMRQGRGSEATEDAFCNCNEARPRERSDRGCFLPLGKKASS